MDDNFRKGYDEAIMLTEQLYKISLSLSEKILFRHYLKRSQETCEFKTGRKNIAGYHIGEALYMWFENYGIGYEDV